MSLRMSVKAGEEEEWVEREGWNRSSPSSRKGWKVRKFELSNFHAFLPFLPIFMRCLVGLGPDRVGRLGWGVKHSSLPSS